MENLTISAIAAKDPQQLVNELTTGGLDLEQVRQIDFAGLQLLMSLFLDEQVGFEKVVRGTLSGAALGNLIEDGGFLATPSIKGQKDLDNFWSAIR